MGFKGCLRGFLGLCLGLFKGFFEGFLLGCFRALGFLRVFSGLFRFLGSLGSRVSRIWGCQGLVLRVGWFSCIIAPALFAGHASRVGGPGVIRAAVGCQV